jgi:hypothetical protein
VENWSKISAFQGWISNMIRAMIYGSSSMLKDTSTLLGARGFEISPHIGTPGDYVIERAFIEKNSARAHPSRPTGSAHASRQ